MKCDHVALFAFEPDRALGEAVSSHLGVSLSAIEEQEFEDGEHISHPLGDVRGKEAFVMHSLYAQPTRSVNDKLCRLLFLLGTLRDAGASRVTAVVPYLCYARQDSNPRSGEPVTTRYVATLFEAVGTDSIMALDIHNLAAFQNAFRCKTEHLEARELLIDYFLGALPPAEIVVVSPDIGGIKRMEKFRESLSRRLAKPVSGGFIEKYRKQGELSGATLTTEVSDKIVILIDDMISTGKTIARAGAICRAAGARQVYAAATHGLFAGEASALLDDGPIDTIVVTNSVSPTGLTEGLLKKRIVLDASELISSAIAHSHRCDISFPRSKQSGPLR